jgi:formylglycine-generating enzyme required for sulfatase activity
MTSQHNPSTSENTFTSHLDWKNTFPCLADYISRLCSVTANSFVMGIPIEETLWVDESDWERHIIYDERITKRVSLYRDAHPAHNVTLSKYSIGEYPVTVGMWREYCTATGREMPPKPTWGWVDDYPIKYPSTTQWGHIVREGFVVRRLKIPATHLRYQPKHNLNILPAVD